MNPTSDATTPLIKLTRKELVSDQEVRWCPGCGDYAVLAQVQKVLPELGIPRENFAFVSGIGCSSRFPYYMNTYGFHTIHGRAPAIATGLKSARPELSVWVITGDGDALAIGGNHFIHALRRNVDLKIIVFNNRIYGLTKGQYSPTSELGKKAKSTPYGSIDPPFHPLQLALGAGATFVARTTDANPTHMAAVIEQAARHKGTALVEVLQNCVVFNDQSWAFVTDKATRDERTLQVEHGKPLLFAKGTKGIRFVAGIPEVVDIGDDGLESDVHVWDQHTDAALAFTLAGFDGRTLPMALGVLRATSEPVYHEMDAAQEKAVTTSLGEGTLDSLLFAGDTWLVSKRWEDATASEVRTGVLEAHRRIRKILDDLESLSAREMEVPGSASEPLRAEVAKFTHVMERHLQQEEQMLFPILRDIDAWGPMRVDQIRQEHAHQRKQFADLSAHAADAKRSLESLVLDVRQLVTELREDMRREEAEMLSEELFGSDSTVTDGFDG